MMYFDACMKRLILSWVFVMPLLCVAQNPIPDFETVVTKFFSLYHHESSFAENLEFARKKDGWHVQVTDPGNGNRLVSDQIFWSKQKGRYQVLENFLRADKEPLSQKVQAFMNRAAVYSVDGYARCAYYGYAGWDVDMIKDFENSTGKNDTLLEGLARAWSLSAIKFLWYDVQDSTTTDPLQNKLGSLEMPDDARVNKFVEYFGKAVANYTTIRKRNKDYSTPAGPIALKCLNENMLGYLLLTMSNRPAAAKKFVDQAWLAPEDSIAAQKILNPLSKNAILFTSSDSIIYPLLYLQQQYNIRKDVAVIIDNMLSIPAYLLMLQQNNIIAFATPSADFGRKDFQVAIKDFQSFDRKPKTLQDFVQQFKQLRKWGTHENDSVRIFGTEYLYILNGRDSLRIDPGTYITLGDLMQFDMINTNIDQRPVYFSGNEYFRFASYMQPAGGVYQLQFEKQPAKR